MATAFILINAEVGAEAEVLKVLRQIKEVKEAYLVYGAYDIIMKIEADTLERLNDVITWNIRRLSKIKTILTMIVV